MTRAPPILDRLSLCLSGFGATSATRVVLLDWFEFLGGRPGEVIYADGGSARAPRRRLESMAREGLIDRLELTEPGSWESLRDQGYIQEYRSGALARATSTHLAFVKLDTLPVRGERARSGPASRGEPDPLDAWLERDAALLDDDRVFAITNSHLLDPPIGEREARGVRYLEHRFASLNFALMTRARFDEAARGSIEPFARAGFRGGFPASIRCEARDRRALVEWAWRDFIEAHGLVTLSRRESRSWMIMHINKSGRDLLRIRRALHRREGVEAFFDKPGALYRAPIPAWSRAGRRIEGVLRTARRRLRAVAQRPPSPGPGHGAPRA